MRMWNVDPKYLCMQHILGEHNEIHKFRPSFVKQHNMDKRVRLGQIFPSWMKIRHDILVKYLKNHNSPYTLPDISYISEPEHRYYLEKKCSSR